MKITKAYLNEITNKNGVTPDLISDVFGIQLKGKRENQLPKKWQDKLIGTEVKDSTLEIFNNPPTKAEKKRKRDLENLEKIRKYKEKFGITGGLHPSESAKILGRKSNVILTRNKGIDQRQFKKKTNKTKKKQRKEETFYTSKAWRMLRWDVLKKYGFACMVCGRTKKEHDIVIHVDHIKPRSTHPELELDIDNLQVFCDDCNLGKLNRDETDFRPF